MRGWPDACRASRDDLEVDLREEEKAFVSHTHARSNTQCNGTPAAENLIRRVLVCTRRRQFTSLFTTLSDEMKTSFLELTKKMRLAKALPKDQKHAQTKALDMEVHRLLGAKYSGQSPPFKHVLPSNVLLTRHLGLVRVCRVQGCGWQGQDQQGRGRHFLRRHSCRRCACVCHASVHGGQPHVGQPHEEEEEGRHPEDGHCKEDEEQQAQECASPGCALIH